MCDGCGRVRGERGSARRGEGDAAGRRGQHGREQAQAALSNWSTRGPPVTGARPLSPAPHVENLKSDMPLLHPPLEPDYKTDIFLSLSLSYSTQQE